MLVQSVVVVVHVAVALVGVVLEQFGRIRWDYWLEQAGLGCRGLVRFLRGHAWGHVVAVVRADTVAQEHQAVLGRTAHVAGARVREEGVGLDHVAWRVVVLPVLVAGVDVLAPAAVDDLLGKSVLLEQFRDLDLVVEGSYVALGVPTRQELKAAEGRKSVRIRFRSLLALIAWRWAGSVVLRQRHLRWLMAQGSTLGLLVQPRVKLLRLAERAIRLVHVRWSDESDVVLRP